MDVRSLCLGILSLGDASGYEIKKAFEDGALSHIHAASFGSIYPALNALVDGGLAVVREVEQEKRPDKRVYSITPAGQTALRLALACVRRRVVLQGLLHALGHLIGDGDVVALPDPRRALAHVGMPLGISTHTRYGG